MRPAEEVPSSTRALDRRAVARDLWPGGTLKAWHGIEAPRPARVWWPEDDDDVLAVLREADAVGVPVVPYGAGSGVCGGARGIDGSWTLDLKRLDRIGRVDPETWIVEVEAGVNGQNLEDELAHQGFTLGHSPSSIGCSTVGGWAAARSAGQLSNSYGVFEDMVLGLDAVAPGVGAFTVGLAGQGRSYPKRPDAELDLLLGSEGTLAVITRLRLRVRPLPAARWLRGYRFDDVPTALRAMHALMAAEVWPSAVRLYDPVDTWIGGRTKPKHGHGDGHRAWWKDWLASVDAVDPLRQASLAVPLAVPRLLQGIAEQLASGCLLIVGFEGPREVVEVASAAGHAILTAAGRDLGAEPGERWWASRHAVSYKLMPIFERGGFADTMEIAARWSVLPVAYEAVRRAVRGRALVMAHFSHVYPEGGCIYFSFAARGDERVYDGVWKAAQDAVLASGATITHHHGVGALKAAWASREAGPAVAAWRSLKQTFDPRGGLNPGRLFVTVPHEDPPSTRLVEEDGLAEVAPAEAVALAGRMWPWASLPAPARHARSAWQSGWIEVRGSLEGRACALGRGPRSAAGPDLRGYLATHGVGVTVSVALAHPGARWMGRAKVEAPWGVVRALLRAGLRPGQVGVVDGWLHVGFRGPAAASFGGLAGSLVPGGLEQVAWRELPLAAGELEPCAPDDPRAVAATSELVLRPVEVP